MLTRRPRLALDGAAALITGASSGIGAATADLLARKGCRLTIVGRDPSALTAVADRTGAHACVADLDQAAGVQDIMRESVRALGKVDLLVCNAGVGWAGPLETMPRDEIDRLIRVNLLGNLHLVRQVLPGMTQRGRGHIVLVSSIAGSMGVADEAVYSASKAGLRVFGESVRMEFADRGIGVTVVLPGAVRTSFFSRRGTPYQRRLPRPVSAEAVARALVDGVERGRAEVFVPRWLHLPARLQGAVPELVRPLQRRLG